MGAVISERGAKGRKLEIRKRILLSLIEFSEVVASSWRIKELLLVGQYEGIPNCTDN